MLYTSVFADDESGYAVLMAGAVAVATLVVLACRLSGAGRRSLASRCPD
jgi:hypothetical protein